jgi:putative flippase GtrA
MRVGTDAQPRSMLGQLWRFGLVGVGTNLAGYLAYLGLTHAGLPPKVTMAMLYVLGAGLSFVLNRQWTFGHNGTLSVAGGRFALAHAGGFAVNFAMLATLHDRLGWPHELVQAMAILVVAAGLFVAFRLFVFPVRVAE